MDQLLWLKEGQVHSRVLLHKGPGGRSTSARIILLAILYYLTRIILPIVEYISHLLLEINSVITTQLRLHLKYLHKPLQFMVDLNQFTGSCHSWPSPGDTLGP